MAEANRAGKAALQRLVEVAGTGFTDTRFGVMMEWSVSWIAGDIRGSSRLKRCEKLVREVGRG